MKRTGTVIDKEELGSNLSWRPEGRCNSFTKQSILASAPPSSGVYGLVNFDRQIFIGESDSIREALLRHESETDFKSHSLKPTGFTFELCGAESRKLWAAELISRFQPVLQKEAALAEKSLPSKDPILDERDKSDWMLGTDADHQEFPIHEREERPKVSSAVPNKANPGCRVDVNLRRECGDNLLSCPPRRLFRSNACDWRDSQVR